jgi:hypothetical protein
MRQAKTSTSRALLLLKALQLGFQLLQPPLLPRMAAALPRPAAVLIWVLLCLHAAAPLLARVLLMWLMLVRLLLVVWRDRGPATRRLQPADVAGTLYSRV